MAGIGFELRRLLRKETFIGEVQAYLYSTIISSGPWLLSVFCLAFLGIYFARRLDTAEQMLFRVSVVYCYAFSLIITGPVQLAATRYLADRHYAGDDEATVPAFITVLAVTLPLQAALAIWFLGRIEAGLIFKLAAGTLYLTISGIWLSMVFLSAAKDYRSIVLAFFVGTCLSLVGSVFLGDRMGLDGLMAGYVGGQILIFLSLVLRIVIEFEVAGRFSRGVLEYLFGRVSLVAAGLALNLGIWIDKMVFWWSDEAKVIDGLLASHQLYETSTFLAYLTIIPSLSYFLIKVETDFYDQYRTFFTAITRKRAFGSIREMKARMSTTLSEGLRSILIIQGATTGLALYLAPWLMAEMNLSALYLGVLRAAILGAFLQSLFLLTVIILFYFDLRGQALVLSLFFLTANGLLSWLSLKLGFPYYGYGYALASLLSLLLGAAMLEWGLKNLEYLVFAKQPVS